jgi:hypothetical protein
MKYITAYDVTIKRGKYVGGWVALLEAIYDLLRDPQDRAR